jgi:hypothetical protein
VKVISGRKPHRDRGHHFVGGGADHRNIVGARVRYVGVIPIQGDGYPLGRKPHRDRGYHRFARRGDHAGVISLLRATRLGRVEQEAPSGPLFIANVRTPAKKHL